MKLFKLTAKTIFLRKSWAIVALLVVVLPFFLPMLSTSTENPAEYKPALAQASWAMALLCTIFWGFFAASSIGDKLSNTGLGEYFLSTGVSATRQLLQTWAALAIYILPLGFAAAAVCCIGASPKDIAEEKTMWIATNLQYAILFTVVVAPLIALAISVASRFGSITGFVIPAGLTCYGLYGVLYMDLLLKLEDNPILAKIWAISPHYHLIDPTERLRYKLGEIEWGQFPLLLGYFFGILLVYSAISRLIFRPKSRA